MPMKTKISVKVAPLAMAAMAAVLITPKLYAQGTVWLNNYDSGMGIYEFPRIPARLGTSVEVLGGISAASMMPLLSWDGVGPIFSVDKQNGGVPTSGALFDGGYGTVRGVPPGATGWFQVLAWSGAPTYQTAPLRGQSQPWSQLVGPAGPLPANPPIAATATLNISAPIILVPEPEPIALAALGAGALLAHQARAQSESGRCNSDVV